MYVEAVYGLYTNGTFSWTGHNLNNVRVGGLNGNKSDIL